MKDKYCRFRYWIFRLCCC